MTKTLSNCNYHLYADYLQLYISFTPVDCSIAVLKMNEDLDRVVKWASRNALVLNPTKSHFLVMDSRAVVQEIQDSGPEVKIYSFQINQVSEARYLGVIFDNSLH